MLHVTPPMGPLSALRGAGPELVNEAGFVTVDKSTMRHTKLLNVFALGDCADSPNSKTAAAVGECPCYLSFTRLYDMLYIQIFCSSSYYLLQ